MRYYLDFGDTNGGLTPPVFTWFRDAATLADLTPPTLLASTGPAWTYYFDVAWPLAESPSTISIDYGITLNGFSLTDVISVVAVSAPASVLSSAGAGGDMTLAELRNLIRSESDTENDPHIDDINDLNRWVNQSRMRLYGKLVTSFGDDYYSAKATIALDGTTSTIPLPDGVLYAAAQPYFKGLLLEAIGGASSASPECPIPLDTFNLRDRARGRLQQIPKYRLVGNNIELNALPSGGLTLQAWYAPKLPLLRLDTDMAEDWNGWLELVVVDCVIKVLGKQERDASLFIARQNQLREEIQREAESRNIGEPATVTVTDHLGGLWG